MHIENGPHSILKIEMGQDAVIGEEITHLSVQRAANCKQASLMITSFNHVLELTKSSTFTFEAFINGAGEPQIRIIDSVQ